MHEKVHLFLNRDVFFLCTRMFIPPIQTTFLISRYSKTNHSSKSYFVCWKEVDSPERLFLHVRTDEKPRSTKKVSYWWLDCTWTLQNDYNLHGLPEKTEANDSGGRNVRLWNVLIIYLQRGKFTLLFIFLSRGINNDK